MEASSKSKSNCDSCSDSSCSAFKRQPGESDQDFQERQKLQQNLCQIRHKIIVLSGKGGVGKSTVAVNLAVALMLSGRKVGLLDVDIHGPSVPTMLGLERETIHTEKGNLVPVDIEGLKVLSMGFLLRSQDDAVIWRGPILDAAMTHCLFHHGVQGVTGDLHVRFLKPIPCNALLDLKAWVSNMWPPLYYLSAELIYEGQVMARAEAKFIRYDEPINAEPNCNIHDEKDIENESDTRESKV